MSFGYFNYNVVFTRYTTAVSVLCRSDTASAEMEELARVSANPDEINLGDSDEEEGGGVEEVPVVGMETQTIPSAVFGSISEEIQGKVLGAKERFAQKKK